MSESVTIPSGDFVTTTLNGAMSSGATTATIGTGLTLPAANGVLQIDYDSVLGLAVTGGPETITYTGYNSGTGALTGITRGKGGTTGVAHASGSNVQAGPSMLYWQNLGDLTLFNTWTAWVPVFTGFSVDPSIVSARYAQIGKTVFFAVNMGQGTSNTTAFTMTLPVAAKLVNLIIATGNRTDNGTAGTVGSIVSRAASTTADVYANINGAAWTGSGGKCIVASGFYEAN